MDLSQLKHLPGQSGPRRKATLRQKQEPLRRTKPREWRRRSQGRSRRPTDEPRPLARCQGSSCRSEQSFEKSQKLNKLSQLK
jgi:hypothetical protein